MDRQRPEGRRRGLRLFQRKMEQLENVSGTSLSAIQSYLRGVEPTRPFIEAAAEVLNVRAAWLAFDEGAPTQAEEAARREAGELPPWQVAADEEFAALLPWDSMETPSRTRAWHLWSLVLNNVPVALPDHVSGDEITEWLARDAAQRTARAVTAPADALHVALPGWTTSRALDSYMTLVMEALLVLLNNPEEESDGEA